MHIFHKLFFKHFLPEMSGKGLVMLEAAEMWQSSLPLPLLLTLACLVWNILQVSWNIFVICYLWILSTLLYWLWDWDTILGCQDTCLNRFKITKTFNLLRFIDWGLDFNSAIYWLAVSQYTFLKCHQHFLSWYNSLQNHIQGN